LAPCFQGACPSIRAQHIPKLVVNR
jgi:epsin